MFNIAFKKYTPPYMIHSDAGRMFGYIRDRHSPLNRQHDFLSLHFDLLCDKFGKDNLIFPSFNYDFPKDKIFDLVKTPSQVGSLTNYIIQNHLLKRTSTPIFSFLTNIHELLIENKSPFSSGSVFDRMHQMDGTILFYGTKIDSCTYLHYVEDQFGPPLYRYQKEFTGLLVDGRTTREVEVEFHVRPMGIDLKYDWDKLNQLLIYNNAITILTKGCFAVKIKDLSKIWGDLFYKNQFEILSTETKKPIIEKYRKLGRRFKQSDFESPQ